ncbi:hypothetical protein BpHYR1_046753 [Brachionus plicatilis]|uniref:Uncharacterized protein n=1 Tax=Brachionus plicatilis TaxID=10195 RepID=A0A3M7QVA6_BRAPC|nr:hypothetical protein BpHYR1_046753 [Brachionus plicatilis]
MATDTNFKLTFKLSSLIVCKTDKNQSFQPFGLIISRQQESKNIITKRTRRTLQTQLVKSVTDTLSAHFLDLYFFFLLCSLQQMSPKDSTSFESSSESLVRCPDRTKFWYTNASSLNNKMHMLESTAFCLEPDIIGITETWFCPSS